MRKSGALLVLLLAQAACSPGGRGALVPISAPGVTLESTQGQPNDTARLSASGVTVEANGRWGNTGESLEVVYHASRLPLTISVASASVWKGHSITANHVWDQTKEEPGSVMGKSLLDAGVLRLRANETRKVVFDFDRPSLADHDRPALDDEVTITVPMPGEAVPVRFRAEGG